MTYLLPKGVFRQFNSTIGINCKLGAEAGIVFEVFGDDILLAQKICKTKNDTQTLNCDIAGVNKLTIKIQSAGPVLWPDNSHAIWGNPLLIKNK